MQYDIEKSLFKISYKNLFSSLSYTQARALQWNNPDFYSSTNAFLGLDYVQAGSGYSRLHYLSGQGQVHL
jgi:hypothetical protein